MTSKNDDYPVLDLIRDKCGADIAEQLQAAFGGCRLYVGRPDKLNEQSPLVKKLGWTAALKVAEAAGGVPIDAIVPLGDTSMHSNRTDAIENGLRQGRSVRDVAREAGAHERTVFRIRKKLKEQETPDVLRMLSRGRAVDDIRRFTILSTKEIGHLRSRLVAEGKLRPASASTPTNPDFNPS